MSRVGKVPVNILKGVKVQVQGTEFKAEGPKGKLTYQIPEGVSVKIVGEQVQVERDSSAPLKTAAALQGTTRTVIHNMIHGVHTGFTKELDIVGVGFRAAAKGNTLNLTLGFSHPVDVTLPEGVTAKVEKNTHLILSAADKVKLGLIASQIRALRKPEPFQGKGIRYSDERIIRKQGKAAGAK